MALVNLPKIQSLQTIPVGSWFVAHGYPDNAYKMLNPEHCELGVQALMYSNIQPSDDGEICVMSAGEHDCGIIIQTPAISTKYEQETTLTWFAT